MFCRILQAPISNSIKVVVAVQLLRVDRQILKAIRAFLQFVFANALKGTLRHVSLHITPNNDD
jgi:hypothetical protein